MCNFGCLSHLDIDDEDDYDSDDECESAARSIRNIGLYESLQQSGYESTFGTILITHPPSAVENLNDSYLRNMSLKCCYECIEDQSGVHLDRLQIINDDVCGWNLFFINVILRTFTLRKIAITLEGSKCCAYEGAKMLKVTYIILHD